MKLKKLSTLSNDVVFKDIHCEITNETKFVCLLFEPKGKRELGCN